MTENIKLADISDIETIAKLANLLWPDHTLTELINEFRETITDKQSQFFLKYESGSAIGFAICQLRHDYVEGTSSSPVGYLEGIFVKQEYRHKGYGKELVEACEKWAKANNCLEFASDCELDNLESFNFHKAMQFTEANRIICFTKKL